MGKTFAMLEAARSRLAEGVDVLAAVIETHGRAETEAILRGIPVLPRRPVFYRDRILSEMDLDALLARRPALALIDELAHTNADGSRHEKRWQDVEEVLEAGIDVYTTLNVQHIETLNDTVARITGVRVRETVPDRGAARRRRDRTGGPAPGRTPRPPARGQGLRAGPGPPRASRTSSPRAT